VYKSNFQKRAFFKVSMASSTTREDRRNVKSKSSSAMIVITSRANRSKRCDRKKDKISVDVTLDKEENRLATLSDSTGNKFQRHL
jgi:hypothetical protein